MKKYIFCIISLLLMVGCQNQKLAKVQIDTSMIEKAGLYQINQVDANYIVFYQMDVDPKSIQLKNDKDRIVISFEKETSGSEDVLAYKLDSDSIKNKKICVIDEQGKEYSFETVFVNS